MADTKPQKIIIGAQSENGVIGRGDGMPWNVPDEYQHFVDSVAGQTVVIGRRSYEIFGADFKANTFVVTSLPRIEGAVAVPSLEEAILQANELEKPIFLSGGRSIYRQSFEVADRMLLSTIKGNFEGDVYFPEFDRSAWHVVSEEDRGDYVLRDWRKGPSHGPR